MQQMRHSCHGSSFIPHLPQKLSLKDFESLLFCSHEQGSQSDVCGQMSEWAETLLYFKTVAASDLTKTPAQFYTEVHW